MSKLNIHPDLLRDLRLQIPKGFQLSYSKSRGIEDSIIGVRNTKGELVEKVIEKVCISELFKSINPRLVVKDGETIANVIKRVIETYNLPVLEGVDLHHWGDRVHFASRVSYDYTLRVPEDSIIYKGGVDVTLMRSSSVPEDIGLVGLGTSITQAKMVLMSKPWKLANNKLVFSGNRLTKNFRDLIYTNLPARLQRKVTQEQLTDAVVVDYLHDGISDVCFVKVGKETFPIRYKTIESDKPNI